MPPCSIYFLKQKLWGRPDADLVHYHDLEVVSVNVPRQDALATRRSDGPNVFLLANLVGADDASAVGLQMSRIEEQTCRRRVEVQ